MEENKPKNHQSFSLLGHALHIGVAISTTVLLFIGAGLWLDKKLGTLPLFLLIGVLLSMVASGYEVYRIIRSLK